MRVELIPSSIPASDTQFLVSFLVNDAVAIDAGALGLLADLDRQEKVQHVFITHEHLDHIASLAIFLENVYRPGPDCVEVLGSQDVLDFLHRDIFNGRVWPDFFELSQPGNTFVSTTVLKPWQPVRRAGLTITPVPVSHSVETLGLVVDDGAAAVGFPSDTGPKVPQNARSIVVHRKARFAAEIAREIAAHGLSGVEMVRAGFGYEF